MKKSKFSNAVIDNNRVRTQGHLAKVSQYASTGNRSRGTRKKWLTDKEVNDMKMLNIFVKESDDFFNYDPANLDPSSDVDEEGGNKKKKTIEDQFMGSSNSLKPINVNEEIDTNKILSHTCKQLDKMIKNNRAKEEDKDLVRLRKGLFLTLDEYYLAPLKAESDSDMDLDKSDDIKGKRKIIPAGIIPGNGENSLRVKAIKFIFDWGVSSVLAEIVDGMREYGAKLKGTQVKILLPPDFNSSIAKENNLFEIMSPMPISEKLARSQIQNVMIWREARLSMIKEEEDCVLIIEKKKKSIRKGEVEKPEESIKSQKPEESKKYEKSDIEEESEKEEKSNKEEEAEILDKKEQVEEYEKDKKLEMEDELNGKFEELEKNDKSDMEDNSDSASKESEKEDDSDEKLRDSDNNEDWEMEASEENSDD
jgi:hypothetical protein